MRTPRVVALEPALQTESQCGHGSMLPKIDFFVFQTPPESLDKHVVHPSPAPVHTDFYAQFEKTVRPLLRGELAALVGIEDLRDLTSVAQCVFKRLKAQTGLHRVGDRPAEHLA